MSDEFTWLRHSETGGTFRCPNAAVDDWLDMGWEVADEAPADPNPVVAEHLAYREQQAAAAQATEDQPADTGEEQTQTNRGVSRARRTR